MGGASRDAWRRRTGVDEGDDGGGAVLELGRRRVLEPLLVDAATVGERARVGVAAGGRWAPAAAAERQSVGRVPTRRTLSRRSRDALRTGRTTCSAPPPPFRVDSGRRLHRGCPLRAVRPPSRTRGGHSGRRSSRRRAPTVSDARTAGLPVRGASP
eukprot:1149309-Prymnesium_polylepis.1